MSSLKHRLIGLGRGTVTRICAVWFVVSTALPFTAPFATFDLADVWAHTHPQHTVATIAPTVCGAHEDSADDVGTTERLVRTTRWVLVPLTASRVDASAPPVTLFRGSAASVPPPLDLSALVPTLRL
jgi:hypothetical protein